MVYILKSKKNNVAAKAKGTEFFWLAAGFLSLIAAAGFAHYVFVIRDADAPMQGVGARWEATCQVAEQIVEDGERIPLVRLVKGGIKQEIPCTLESRGGYEGRIYFTGGYYKELTLSASPAHIYLKPNEKIDILISAEARRNLAPVSLISGFAGSDGNSHKIKFVFEEGPKPALPQIRYDK